MKVETLLYQCDICGNQSIWNADWYTHIFPLDISGDMTFHVCSEYCDRVLLSKGLKERRKLYKEINYPKSLPNKEA